MDTLVRPSTFSGHGRDVLKDVSDVSFPKRVHT